MFKRITYLLIVLFLPASITAAVLNFDNLIKLKRLGDFDLSDDGKYIVYSLGEVVFNENRINYDLYLMNLEKKKVVQLTDSETSENSPQWADDNKHVYYLSESKEDNKTKIFRINIDTLNTEHITNFPLSIESFYLSDDGKSMLFTAVVFAECEGDIECSKKKFEEEEKSKVNAQLIDNLLYRHWDRWYDGKYRHLFYYNINSKKYVDVSPNDLEVPPFSLGGERDFDISKDGREIAFVVNRDEDLSTSTNKDIILSQVNTQSQFKLTLNKGYDGYPRFSPNGRYIAYRSQFTPNYESDRFRLILYDRVRNKLYDLTSNFDNWVEEVVWSKDGKYLYFTVDEGGYTPIYRINISNFEKNGFVKREKIVDNIYCYNLKISKDNNLYFAVSSLSEPSDIYSYNGQDIKKLTSYNDKFLSSLSLGDVENIEYSGAERNIQAFIVKPPYFNSGSKYPLLYLIHGGPQSVWSDSWSYRWNAQLFASRGYVVMMPNPTGSVGFGQDFINDVSGDWGGKVYEDLMKGVDFATTLPYVDSSKMGAAGASFGGYMINWIEGHTNRFKALVSHDGVFNIVSFMGSTEELWFPFWEFGGPYWESRQTYEEWSPHNYVENFSTPCLVIHGGLDYRVDLSEGLQLFTALKQMDVPSKFLYFPDEGHWVLKQQNSKLWYNTILDWFDSYLK
ncbi:MAG: S9 family peptidase [Deferribacterota bacterium]|nr:S9 family peptidase [Deferribacterota bacterium]